MAWCAVDTRLTCHNKSAQVRLWLADPQKNCHFRQNFLSKNWRLAPRLRVYYDASAAPQSLESRAHRREVSVPRTVVTCDGGAVRRQGNCNRRGTRPERLTGNSGAMEYKATWFAASCHSTSWKTLKTAATF